MSLSDWAWAVALGAAFTGILALYYWLVLTGRLDP